MAFIAGAKARPPEHYREIRNHTGVIYGEREVVFIHGSRVCG